jgi:hypothetical protein
VPTTSQRPCARFLAAAPRGAAPLTAAVCCCPPQLCARLAASLPAGAAALPPLLRRQALAVAERASQAAVAHALVRQCHRGLGDSAAAAAEGGGAQQVQPLLKWIYHAGATPMVAEPERLILHGIAGVCCCCAARRIGYLRPTINIHQDRARLLARPNANRQPSPAKERARRC